MYILCSVAPLMVSAGEAKECFIKLFIVDNCTISLIIRSYVNISAVYSEMAFVILGVLKRDFGIFIKENSGVLMPFTPC